MVYITMMAHFAIGSLIHEAALKADEDPDQLSFLHAVRVVRRRLPIAIAIPPVGIGRPSMTRISTKSSKNASAAAATGETGGVKRKMSNFPLRRRSDPPLPAIDIAIAILIVK